MMVALGAAFAVTAALEFFGMKVVLSALSAIGVTAGILSIGSNFLH
jgi:hypothetical protein